MEMKRCTAAILLMLSLGALLAGRLSAAVADDGVDTIRLPSQGLADELVMEEEAKPPKCCELARCTRMFPPTCQCVDQVKKCAKTCKSCEKQEDSSLYVCRDSYAGMPDPMCTKTVTNGPGVAILPVATGKASEKTVDDGEEKARPWKCCDLARCTRSFPPTCQCLDKVKKCAKACESCEKVEGSSRYVCLDQYRGKQGPACTPAAPPPPTFTPRGN